MTFLVNTFYYNEPVWYTATTDDWKSFDLLLFTFNAPYTAPPPAQLFLWQSEGRWCCNVLADAGFIQRLGQACEAALKSL